MQAIFDLLAELRVPFLIIGGHSLAAHGYQRMTLDIDCLVAAPDFSAIAELLERAGYINVQHQRHFSAFFHPESTISKIDVMRVDAATFQKMHAASRVWDFGGTPLAVPALDHLIALKLHAIKNNPARRTKDGPDIARLLEANPGAISRARLREVCEQFGPPGEWDILDSTYADDTP